MSCLNRKTLAIVAAVALAVLVLAPSSFGRAAPLLVAAACPLGMILMMRGVAGGCRRKEAGDSESEGNAGAPSPTPAPQAEPRP